jgi:Holliday junction resolvase RusA-like endonuclease
MSLHITVTGTPRPQGSKDQFGREASKGLPAWRSDIRTAATEVMLGIREFTEGRFWNAPIAVTIQFTMPRPNGHYLPANTRRAARALRPDAPTHHTGKPDIDKLERAVLDALSGLVYRDDAQVVHVEKCKVYGERPGADITVSEAP